MSRRGDFFWHRFGVGTSNFAEVLWWAVLALSGSPEWLRVSREQDHGAQGAANTEGSGIYESLVHALRAHAQPGDGYASKAYIIGVHRRLRGHRANLRLRALQLRSSTWRRAATSRAINRPGL